MPEQKTKDYGKYASNVMTVIGFASDNAGVGKVIKKELQHAESLVAKALKDGDFSAHAKANTHLIDLKKEKGALQYLPVADDHKAWSKADLEVLAADPSRGLRVFNSLAQLALAAGRIDKNGHAVDEDAELAQKAFAAVTPEGMTRQQYSKVITQVAVASQKKHNGPKVGHVGGEEPPLDEKAVQTLLAQGGVTLDAEHSLKKPLDKALAGVVQQLKGTSRT